MLQRMGAKIRGMGTSMLRIEGVAQLRGGTFAINSDYHEIVTFLALGRSPARGARRAVGCRSIST